MTLDPATFGDRPYYPMIGKLQETGFQFTTMDEKGNTEYAQCKLYTLDDALHPKGRILFCGVDLHWDRNNDHFYQVEKVTWINPDGVTASRISMPSSYLL